MSSSTAHGSARLALPCIALLVATGCTRGTKPSAGVDASMDAPVTCGTGTVQRGDLCVVEAPPPSSKADASEVPSGASGTMDAAVMDASSGMMDAAPPPVDMPTGGTGGMGDIVYPPIGGIFGIPPTGGFVGGGGPAPVICDPGVPTVVTCGGTSCPAPSGAVECQVPCCSAGNACGFRTATVDIVTACIESPREDPACPDYTGPRVLRALQGCCYDGETCGFISANSCVIEHGFIPDLADRAGAPCGDGDAGTDPSGISDGGT